MDAKMLGRRLRDARRMAGKHQSDVAEAIGISQSAVSDYERGDRITALLVDNLEAWGLPEDECEAVRAALAEGEKEPGGASEVDWELVERVIGLCEDPEIRHLASVVAHGRGCSMAAALVMLVGGEIAREAGVSRR